MPYAIVRDGRVENIILADAPFAASINAESCADFVGIGWIYKGSGVFIAPTPSDLVPLTAPQTVTRRQGLQALRMHGITEAMIEGLIAGIPDDLMRDLALIEFRASQVFERHRPLVVGIGAQLGLSLDELFIQAGSL